MFPQVVCLFHSDRPVGPPGLATTATIRDSGLVDDRLDLAVRIVQDALDLVHLEGRQCRRRLLHTLDKFPVEVLANLLPDRVVRYQTVSRFEEWEIDLVLVEFEEFKELV